MVLEQFRQPHIFTNYRKCSGYTLNHLPKRPY